METNAPTQVDQCLFPILCLHFYLFKIRIYYVFCSNFYKSICRNVLEQRQLDGAMHRVPPGFYSMGEAYHFVANRVRIKICYNIIIFGK